MRISEYLSLDHSRCDGLFAKVEESTRSGDWSRIAGDLDAFVAAMERHFRIEEQTVFPALTAANDMWAPPTEVMKHDHDEMRSLFEDLEQAVSDKDADSVQGLTETLLFNIQVHNAKEENILYRMIDEALDHDSGELLERIEDSSDGASP